MCLSRRCLPLTGHEDDYVPASRQNRRDVCGLRKQSDCALDAVVKAKLDNYLHDYNERNFFFLPAVKTTSGRISGDFLRLLYILSDRQADSYFARMGLLDPSTKAFKQRRGSYFYYNRAAIGSPAPRPPT